MEPTKPVAPTTATRISYFFLFEKNRVCLECGKDTGCREGTSDRADFAARFFKGPPMAEFFNQKNNPSRVEAWSSFGTILS
jgi:hypothetical protein